MKMPRQEPSSKNESDYEKRKRKQKEAAFIESQKASLLKHFKKHDIVSTSGGATVDDKDNSEHFESFGIWNKALIRQRKLLMKCRQA